MQIVVEAKQVEDQNLSYTQVLEDYGTYSLQSILPGRYLVSCFIDTDGDGVYDYGNPFPFQPSEPFAVLEDTVKVRSRWPNEGNDIVLFRH